MTPQNKGSAFRCTLFAIKDMLAARYDAYVAALPEATRAFAINHPTASQWIDARHEVVLIDVAVATMYGDDLSQAFEIGRRSIASDIKGIYRAFVKILDPEFVIKRAPMIWSLYYRDNGRVQVLGWSKQHCRILYEDVTIASEPYWHNIKGSMTAIAQATRLRDIGVEFVGEQTPHTRTLEIRWGGI